MNESFLDSNSSPAPGAASRLVGFVRLLRERGFTAGLTETQDTLRLAASLDLGDIKILRWSLRALLCAREPDWHRYDELFDAYWLGRGVKQELRLSGSSAKPGAPLETQGPQLGGTSALPSRVERDGDIAAAGGDGRRGGASPAETLATTDLRYINDPEQLAQVHELTERLAARLRYRLGRRQRIAHRGRRIDLRKTIHRSIPYGGMPMHLGFLERRPRPFRVVVLLDVSGSMSQYSAFFVRFIHGVLREFRDAEAFVFHTRLVHLSNALKDRNTERALERLSLLASGWSGGTRIGACLADFNRGYAAAMLNSRSLVIIVSDGYDTCPPEQLDAELTRLKRRTRRLVWLNPMAGWEGYEPVAGGMAAALPHIDLFAPAHNLESLRALEPYLMRL